MTRRFTDPRLLPLNDDGGFVDAGMRGALLEALESGERAIAAYSVSAHIWVHAVLTDRALLLVKGAVRARVTRVPLPLEHTRTPTEVRKGVRVVTPLGRKTLWGSRLDPEARLLLGATRPAGAAEPALEAPAGPARAPEAAQPAPAAPAAGRTRRKARRAAGPRPRRPRARRVRKPSVGFAPSPTIWDLADRCVKCGRPLTDPRSRRARVGTRCILVYGSQQRRVPNPAHAAWTARKAKADAAYVAAKVEADAELARARATYEESLAEWRRVRSGR